MNPPPFWITFDLDYRVMLFVLGLIVLASLFAGALPAMHAVRRERRCGAEGRQPLVDERQPRAGSAARWSSRSWRSRAAC